MRGKRWNKNQQCKTILTAILVSAVLFIYSFKYCCQCDYFSVAAAVCVWSPTVSQGGANAPKSHKSILISWAIFPIWLHSYKDSERTPKMETSTNELQPRRFFLFCCHNEITMTNKCVILAENNTDGTINSAVKSNYPIHSTHPSLRFSPVPAVLPVSANANRYQPTRPGTEGRL